MSSGPRRYWSGYAEYLALGGFLLGVDRLRSIAETFEKNLYRTWWRQVFLVIGDI